MRINKDKIKRILPSTKYRLEIYQFDLLAYIIILLIIIPLAFYIHTNTNIGKLEMSKEILIESLKKSKEDLIDEFESEGLHLDDDTITSVELSIYEIEYLIDAVKAYEEDL